MAEVLKLGEKGEGRMRNVIRIFLRFEREGKIVLCTRISENCYRNTSHDHDRGNGV